MGRDWSGFSKIKDLSESEKENFTDAARSRVSWRAEQAMLSKDSDIRREVQNM